ncbi:MAG TPA: hypothetical protein ENJ50_00975, partial [Planctomycetaceae bacterium]|nr:hypothetical protein [Planctomycetaceae bacterium]
MRRKPGETRSMRWSWMAVLFVVWLACLSTPLLAGDSDESGKSAEEIFATVVYPLFQERCLSCHGRNADEIEGDFDMRTRASLLQGGGSGEPGVIPGKPDQSPLYRAVMRDEEDDWSKMPPKENDRLSQKEIEAIRAWIAGGAPWPNAARIEWLQREHRRNSEEDTVVVRTSGGLSPHWTQRRYARKDVWAYQPLRQVSPPPIADHPIDAFLEARLPEGLDMAPP